MCEYFISFYRALHLRTKRRNWKKLHSMRMRRFSANNVVVGQLEMFFAGIQFFYCIESSFLRLYSDFLLCTLYLWIIHTTTLPTCLFKIIFQFVCDFFSAAFNTLIRMLGGRVDCDTYELRLDNIDAISFWFNFKFSYQNGIFLLQVNIGVLEIFNIN